MLKPSVDRFYWLDIIRGIAALSVILWHWQHFFFEGPLSEINDKIIDRSNYPLYSVLRPFYGQGWRAVELFFTLSGFIFFWLYADKVAKREVKFSDYLVLRLSRLYPLHLLTLLVVIGGQIWFHYLNGSYFVYNDYSLDEFLFNLTLTGSWFSSNFSFNGPSWSISVELFLYIMFFTLCTLNFSKWWQAAAIVLIGYFLRGTFLDSLATGIMSFFSGGITYYCFNWINARLDKKGHLALVLFILPGVLIGAIVVRYVIKVELPLYFYELCLFPLVILSIALAEAGLGTGVGKRLTIIGDISYSSYLWHFPLQLGFILVVRILNWDNSVFYSPQTLALFYIILIIISLLSFHYIERPAQKYLRNWWKTNHNVQETLKRPKVA